MRRASPESERTVGICGSRGKTDRVREVMCACTRGVGGDRTARVLPGNKCNQMVNNHSQTSRCSDFVASPPRPNTFPGSQVAPCRPEHVRGWLAVGCHLSS